MLIFIFVIYLCIYISLGVLRTQIDSDMILVYKSKNSLNEIFFSMNTFRANWESGKPFERFKEEILYHDEEIVYLYKKISSRWFYPNTIQNRINSLEDVWNILAVKINWIVNRFENPNFVKIIENIERELRIQQLNRLWIEMFYSGNVKEKERAFMLEKVLSEIEYFPTLHGSEMNQLYDIIINEMHDYDSAMKRLQTYLSIIFFIIFIVIIFFLSSRFTLSISKPIKKSIDSLAHFMGSSVKKVEPQNDDEIELLSKSVSDLIAHYTKLAQDAKKIAEGDIENTLIPISEYDVVGNALKEILTYMRELAHASSWIREGRYSSEIKVKSNKDILANAFNVMSRVIAEQITTLRNIFDAVEEGIAVIDEDKNIVEANDNFLKLIRAGALVDLKTHLNIDNIFMQEPNFINNIISENTDKEHFTQITTMNKSRIPVKVVVKKLPQTHGKPKKIMLFVSNESLKMRHKREREKLRAQAAIAELRALRAQINPHFLFNTISTIIYYAKTKPDKAVIVAEKLADLFRYSLASTKQNTVTLEEELEHIQKYVDIEYVRFGERLVVNYDVDPLLGNEKIPPMLLQPLIENAIKYGEDDRGNTTLNISVKKKGDDVLLSIADRGTLKIEFENMTEGHGTGLKNVNQRLKTLYNRELHFEKNSPSGIIVSMMIPETDS